MKHKKINITAILTIILLLLSIKLIYTIYLFKGVENTIRYLIIIILITTDILLFKGLFVHKKKKKKKHKIVVNTSIIITIIIYGFIYINLNDIYVFFKSLNKDISYTTSLITLSTNEITNTKNINNYKIGIIEDNSIDSINQVLNDEKLKDTNDIITYSTYPELITALYDETVNYIFLPSNYIDTYKSLEEFEDIDTKTKLVITSKEFTKEKEEVKLSGSNKDYKDPFSILLMGIDSTTNGFKNSDSFNGDALILLTFNPKTMNVTMLTIPRDSYVPISCFPNQTENKITHAAARGTNCIIETVQNFLDIKIDYYMKINFTGLVDLVNALGGVEVDVPYNICEQNSKREFGNKMVYIRKGHQTLDGEQALAFARNRKKNEEYCSKEWTEGYRDDFKRQEHQQVVLKAILDKAKNLSSLDSLKKIMNVISQNVDTNLSENTIFSFYNLGKDLMTQESTTDILNIIKLYIDGQGQTIYDEGTKLNLWNYIPHKDSVNEVIKAMKVNLEEEKEEDIKEFSFSYGETYDPKPIGKGPYKVYTIYDLLPNFTTMTLTEAQDFANKYNLTLKINYVNKDNYKDNAIISQNYPYKKRIDKIEDKTIELEVNKKNNTQIENKIDCLKSTNDICKLPNFIGKTKEDIISWGNKFSNTINIFFDYKESSKDKNTVLNQDVKEGATVEDLINKKTTITFTISK